MLNDDVLRNWNFDESSQAVTSRDAMLYALGIGLGGDPLDAGQLRFVSEREQQVVPSMAAILCPAMGWLRDPRAGIDFLRILHGEQDVIVHQPLPLEGVIRATARITRVLDKGASKGALIEHMRELANEAGEPLATVRQVVFARGDGGYSAEGGRSDELPEALPPVPVRSPDAEVVLPSLPQAALIYRLSGDYNPLHSDPAVAVKAGFPRPILHGLCTYGMAVHAVLRHACGYDAARLRRMAGRFSAPVFPGETLRFQLWDAGGGGLHVRGRVDARDVTVLDNGWFEVA
ncbi:MAG TPA: MaoC/PaaZ C-terminal domain-containing protein [Ramlibacter sp.]|nr:MaoC/PaaZ C-terminal domain-containing protein [Ramlibacter sp.]